MQFRTYAKRGKIKKIKTEECVGCLWEAYVRALKKVANKAAKNGKKSTREELASRLNKGYIYITCLNVIHCEGEARKCTLHVFANNSTLFFFFFTGSVRIIYVHTLIYIH